MVQKPLDHKLLNIDLLVPEEGSFRKANLGEVLTTSIFEPSSNVFDLKGLFSPVIFGEIGSDERMERPGYVNFKLPVFHPLVYLTICDLGDKYERIMAGELKAKFSNSEKDFIVCGPDKEGSTGFEFFCKYIDKIDYPETDSHKRSFKKALVEKYGRKTGLISEWIILPAGLRDYTIDDKGVPSEDEVNKLYRTLINIANSLKMVDLSDDISLFDSVRFRLQRLLVDIYKHFKTIIDGKNKFIQSKWASRGLNYGTRNVITAMNSYSKDINDNNAISFNNVVIGIFQYLKALGNLVPHRVLNMFISNIGDSGSENIKLFNPETARFELVKASTKMKKDWTSVEGINGIVNKLLQDDIKNSPVKIDGKYMALIQEHGNEVKVIFSDQDITHPDYVDENGEVSSKGRDKIFKTMSAIKKREGLNDPIRPITYVELFYISVCDLVNRFPALITRYPITGAGSIYPAWPKLKTTMVGKERNIKVGLEEYHVYEYPIVGTDYYRSLTVHYSHLGSLGGDHDGDVLSFALVLTDEAIEEIKKLLDSKEYYLDPSNRLIYSVSNHVLDSLLRTLTE